MALLTIKTQSVVDLCLRSPYWTIPYKFSISQIKFMHSCINFVITLNITLKKRPFLLTSKEVFFSINVIFRILRRAGISPCLWDKCQFYKFITHIFKRCCKHTINPWSPVEFYTYKNFNTGGGGHTSCSNSNSSFIFGTYFRKLILFLTVISLIICWLCDSKLDFLTQWKLLRALLLPGSLTLTFSVSILPSEPLIINKPSFSYY